MTKEALGIIDVQRGFMPVGDGDRNPQHGFGELPVPNGEQVIAPINRLLGAYAAIKADIFTTQDWHPPVTAHFSETPDYNTNWPVHCVDGTLGAEIDPRVELPGTRHRFVKGFETLERGEDDTSYSGHYAEDPITGLTLPEWLKHREITGVVLAGVALEHCVGDTAIDLKVKDGLDVTVVLDASRGIDDGRIKAMLNRFDELGIKTTTTDELLAQRQFARAEAA
jgi:nicotinamidase/pyrazinamidase